MGCFRVLSKKKKKGVNPQIINATADETKRLAMQICVSPKISTSKNPCTSIETMEIQESSSSTNICEVAQRPWSELPSDLLELIVDCLGLIELLSFRSVCREWRSAAYKDSAQIISMTNPWFLIYGDNAHGHLYDQSQKRYSICFPDLEGASCIASNDGWLLLLRNESIFFFCPFSRAKIDLPQLPHFEISDHVAAFSSSPTSPDCITVVMINHRNSTIVELNVLQRGAKEWARHEYLYNHMHITCATYCDGNFYFIDCEDRVMTFSVEGKEFITYRIVERDANINRPTLPFTLHRHSYMEKIMELKEDASVSICGTLEPGGKCNTVIHNEHFTANGATEARRHLKGVWIHPRFLQLPANYSWSL